MTNRKEVVIASAIIVTTALALIMFLPILHPSPSFPPSRVVTNTTVVYPAYAESSPIIYNGSTMKVVQVNNDEDWKAIESLLNEGWKIETASTMSQAYFDTPLQLGHYVILTKQANN